VYTDGEQLFTTTDDRSVVALDQDSGTELWRAEADEVANDGTIVSVTAVMCGTAVAVTVDGRPRRVVILDTASGAHR
jgi:outer membrane protein assembly factor BamB